ncbi:hypothetical protein HO173_009455 [Letharia columbiana]|uniref:Uncharacterized protein n=1 Tax=Letharia columbiana TaxID=112416 RepID=A0A8H6FPJ1_9LECA|nr:uncharacterized protein HO173_009455 [Letharia columbiana]KAF6232350.1 hypothetical protein HO173_009455 [Letharia columbiana]
MEESTKPTKNFAQSKGKANATEKPPKASFDNHDVAPSPTRADSTIKSSRNKIKATTAQLEATRVACNDQKQATPVLTKAATTTSSIGPAPRLKRTHEKKPKMNSSNHDLSTNSPSGRNVDEHNDAIWDVNLAHSEERPQILRQSRQPAKTAKKQEVRVPKTKKNKAQTQLHSDKAKADKATKAQTQAPIARVVKAKPAPAALSQPRTRRVAAIKANRKIQGLDESDEIVDDEEIVPTLARSKRQGSSDAAKAPRNHKIGDGRDDRTTSGGKLPTAHILERDSIPDSVSPDSLDEQIPDSVSDPKADSSPEQIDLVRDAPAEASRAAPGDTRDNLQKEKQTSAAETSMILPHAGLGDHSNQRNSTSVEEIVEVSEASANLVIDNIPQQHESVTETDPAPARPQQDNHVKQGHDDLDATKPANPGDQDQVEPVLPYKDDVSLEVNSKSDNIERKVAPPSSLISPTSPNSCRISTEKDFAAVG